ncbi:GNAT family N-acetyltransferase [Pseudovibrio sp. Ad26]|uniref:GNAT family N-acetyltransferase n=1 Tax=Pseudovibrio sp. Ad26 TaxID=989410 RepID=UPI000A03F31F|nr:GNAT family N-acetyltransferase [Pseudovibrio sp. Ad26]
MRKPLVTRRCLLSQPMHADKSALRRLFTNEQTRMFLGGKQSPASIEIRCAKVISETEVYHATVRSRRANEFLGLLSLAPYYQGEDMEVSYEFLPKHWGQGYAEEALNAFLPFAMQELNLPSILAETQLQNTCSIRLLQKLGMQQTRQLERFGEQQVVYRLDL